MSSRCYAMTHPCRKCRKGTLSLLATYSDHAGINLVTMAPSHSPQRGQEPRWPNPLRSLTFLCLEALWKVFAPSCQMNVQAVRQGDAQNCTKRLQREGKEHQRNTKGTPKDMARNFRDFEAGSWSCNLCEAAVTGGSQRSQTVGCRSVGGASAAACCSLLQPASHVMHKYGVMMSNDVQCAVCMDHTCNGMWYDDVSPHMARTCIGASIRTASYSTAPQSATEWCCHSRSTLQVKGIDLNLVDSTIRPGWSHLDLGAWVKIRNFEHFWSVKHGCIMMHRWRLTKASPSLILLSETLDPQIELQVAWTHACCSSRMHHADLAIWRSLMDVLAQSCRTWKDLTPKMPLFMYILHSLFSYAW